MSHLSKLMQVARESIEDETALPPEEQAVALDDTGLTAEVIEEVQAPVADLETGLNDVASAEVEAGALDNTAAMLTETLAEGGQGADPLAAQFAADQIQEAVERFALGNKVVRPAKESFATSAGRREATMSLAKEAEDASKGLKERAIAAIKKAIEWLKEIFKTVTDKAFRIEKRAKALGQAAKGSKAAGGADTKIKAGFLGDQTPAQAAAELVKLPSSLDKLGAMVTDSTGASLSTLDLNPGKVGNVAMRVEVGEKLSFVKEEGQPADGVVKTLSEADAIKVAAEVEKAAGAIRGQKKAFDEMTSKSLGLISALKTEGGVKDRAGAVASVSAVSRAAGAVVSLSLSVGSRLLDVVDASLKAKAAPAADAAAAAA